MTAPRARDANSHKSSTTTGSVILLGWYGSANIGDETVMEATVGALRSRGIRNIHVLSTNPAQTSRKLGVTSSRRNLGLGTLRAMRGADALVLGGGGLIQDGTSVYNLPLYALFIAVARLFRLRVICWGLGVEPIWTRLGKWLARYIVSSSQHFSVRDSGSRHLLRVAGAPIERVRVTADPAFLIPVPMHEANAIDASPNIVFVLRHLSDNHPGLNLHYLLPVSIRKRVGVGWSPPRERVEGLLNAVGAAISYAATDLGAQVHLLPLWPGRDDEILTSARDKAIAIGADPARISLIMGLHTPGQVADKIAGADLLVSMRLHALLFAATAGVPSLSLLYARKMRGQMRALGMERWVVEVDARTPPPEEITRKLAALWSLRREVGVSLARSAGQARLCAEYDANEVAAQIKSGRFP